MEKKALLVDDEAPVLRVMEQLFKNHGFVPYSAISGLDALGLMTQHGFQVVFTDLRMPNMDGMHLCRLIKQFAPRTFVYAVSAFTDAFSPGEFRAAGFDGRFRKPFDNDLLIDACHMAFQNVARGMGRDAARPVERRKHPRILAEEEVRARILTCDTDPGLVGQEFECATRDVSEGGVQIWTDQGLPVGTVLQLTVVVSEQRQRFRLQGAVRWVSGVESSGRSKVGILLSIVSQDRAKWVQFVAHLTGCGTKSGEDGHAAARRGRDGGMTHGRRGLWKPGDRERRREHRVKVHSDVRVRVYNTDLNMTLTDTTFLCHGVDLSRNGIRLSSDVELPIGAELEMLVHVEEPPSVFVHRGKVRWTMRGGEPNTFSVSIELIEGGPSHLRTWSDVVERVWALQGQSNPTRR